MRPLLDIDAAYRSAIAQERLNAEKIPAMVPWGRDPLVVAEEAKAIIYREDVRAAILERRARRSRYARHK